MINNIIWSAFTSAWNVWTQICQGCHFPAGTGLFLWRHFLQITQHNQRPTVAQITGCNLPLADLSGWLQRIPGKKREWNVEWNQEPAEIGCSALISCSVITRYHKTESWHCWRRTGLNFPTFSGICRVLQSDFADLLLHELELRERSFETRRVNWWSQISTDSICLAKKALIEMCPAFRCSEHQSLKCTQRLVYISTKWCWVVAWPTPHDMSPIMAHRVKLFGKRVEAVHTTCL